MLALLISISILMLLSKRYSFVLWVSPSISGKVFYGTFVHMIPLNPLAIFYNSSLHFEGCELYLSPSIAEIEFVGFTFLYGFCIISRRRKKIPIYIILFRSEVLKNDLKIKTSHSQHKILWWLHTSYRIKSKFLSTSKSCVMTQSLFRSPTFLKSLFYTPCSSHIDFLGALRIFQALAHLRVFVHETLPLPCPLWPQRSSHY